MRTSDARYSVAALAVVLSLIFVPLAAVATAQEASPEAAPGSLLTGLGLPEFAVTVTEDRQLLGPSEFPAGPALLTVHNQTSVSLWVGLDLFPEGTTLDDAAAITGLPLPAWWADLIQAGYVLVGSGGSASIGLLLTAGEWTLWAEFSRGSPGLIGEPVTVTGEVDQAAVDAAPSAYTIELGEYAINVPSTVPAGPQIVKVINTHDIPHDVVGLQTDRVYTVDEVRSGIQSQFAQSPGPDDSGFRLLQHTEFLNTAALGAGMVNWIEINLDPGLYILLSTLPDPGGVQPHWEQGMLAFFEVVEN